MVLNDYFDVEVDRKERPFRPIPSARISRRAAGWLGSALLVAGVALAGSQSNMTNVRPLETAVLLALFILLYDGGLKRYWAGPLAMGMCRFLNVLLGQSAGSRLSEVESIHLAAVVGVYIVGVTWFARRETERSGRPQLLAAAAVLLVATILALLLLVWRDPVTAPEVVLYPVLLVAWGVVIGAPIGKAIAKPEPANVQAAIKRCLMGLVGLDAVLAFAFVGWPGLAILLLLVPALWLGRWVYST